MAIILEGSGTVTGITTFTTPLDDIKFDSIEVTGIATASTFQVGTGVSIGNPRLQNIALYTNDTEFVTVDNVGNVGFGTTNAQIAAQASNAKVINAGIVTANQYYGNQLTAAGVRVTGVSTFAAVTGTTGTFSGAVSGTTGTFSGDISIADKIVHTGDTNNCIRFPNTDAFSIETAGTERLRIDSSGHLHSGYSTNVTGADQLNILSADGGGVSVAQNNAGTAPSGTIIGSYSFQGYHQGGATYASAEARISAIAAALHSGSSAATDLAFYTKPAATGPGSSPTEAVRITSTGEVGIGITNPNIFNGGANQLVIQDSGSCGMTIDATSTSNSSIFFADGADGNEAYRGWVQYEHNNDAVTLGTAAGERFRITSNGEVLIGHNAVIGHNGVDGYLQVTGTGSDSSSFNLNRFSADNWCPFITFGKSRNGTKGSHTVVQNGDYIGYIQFAASDGTDFNNSAANIICQIDGTPGTDDTPGRLMFQTCADGSNSPTERLRIHSGGDVEVKTGNLIIGTAGKGIDFSATSDGPNPSSELLDEYEEGTFTPNILVNYSTTDVTQPGTRNGTYTKIGNRVFFGLHISGTFSYSGSNHNVIIGNLPFTANGNASHLTALYLWAYAGISNGEHLIARIKTGNSSAYIQRTNPGASVYVNEANTTNWNFMMGGHYTV